MKISAKGISLIKSYEGLELEAYQCPAGVWTIGYGHTKGVRPRMSIDEKTAEKYLLQDLGEFEKSVNTLVKVPLTDGMYDALVSFTFNLGASNLAQSTLLKKLNLRDYGNAANEFPKWINAGGKPMLGLLKRRIEERKLFLS